MMRAAEVYVGRIYSVFACYPVLYLNMDVAIKAWILKCQYDKNYRASWLIEAFDIMILLSSLTCGSI